MWHLGTWFSSGIGSGGLVIGLNDVNGLFQSKCFYNSVFHLESNEYVRRFSVRQSLRPANISSQYRARQEAFSVQQNIWYSMQTKSTALNIWL